MLTDLQIRKNLDQHIRRRLPSGAILKHEQTLHNGNVIADILAISTSMHVYEIKGDLDKISRLQVQSTYYNKVSPKITLVTTERNLEKALETIPNYWGVLLAKKPNSEVTFKYIRAAKTNVDFSKYHALLALWKSELIEIAENTTGITVKTRHSREDLAELISKNRSKQSVIKLITCALARRYHNVNVPELTSSLTSSI